MHSEPGTSFVQQTGCTTRRVFLLGQNGPVVGNDVFAIDHSVQSSYSDPGELRALLDEIEPTVVGVSAMARNIVVHYRTAGLSGAAEHVDDVNLRWVDAILTTDQRRHGGPLSDPRQPEERVRGCCRDHSLLAVAALRHHGVPARSRVGFASYLAQDWNSDHVIVEAWLEGRWQRFDPEFAGYPPSVIDPADLPHDAGSPFLTAARVWLAHRAGAIDVMRYGGASSFDLAGEWFVHGYVICEVAHRFGDELLLWDIWGARTPYNTMTPASEVALIDEVARLLLRADDADLGAERELLDRYREDERLHPRERVYGCSPAGGTYETDLSSRTTARFGSG